MKQKVAGNDGQRWSDDDSGNEHRLHVDARLVQ
jgi:hypothetical protein